MLAVAGTGSEAVAAIHGLVAARLERNFRYAAALTARCLEHLATATAAAATVVGTAAAAAAAAGRFTRRATIRAPAGLVGESFAGVELLLACGKRKGASAVDAIKGFI